MSKYNIFKIAKQKVPPSISFFLVVVISITIYDFLKKIQYDKKSVEAWQTIALASNKGGDLGRKLALEILNSEHTASYILPLSWRRQNLNGINLSKAYLAGIELPRVQLRRANLSYTNLSNANLYFGDLTGSNLHHADLYMANLQLSNLADANLAGAILMNANLKNTSLWNVIAIGTDFRGSNLSEARVGTMYYTDENTTKDVCIEFKLDYPCPTYFAEKFNPANIFMKLIREKSQLKEIKR